MVKEKLPTLLIFGYPLAYQHLGGLVWIKKVVDCIEKARLFDIKKVSNARMSKTHKFPYVFDILALWKGVFCRPKIAILDTYGEAAIWMWIMIRLLRHDTRIVTVFHHYEPVSNRHKQCGTVRMKYYDLVDFITKVMLRNSDKIITVSNSSMLELKTVAKIKNNKKIIIVGCSSTDYHSVTSNGSRDIDFLCIGRLEKFDRIESIWEGIKKKSPTSKFVMAGRCSSKDLVRLRSVGIDHLGIVSDSKKTDLFSRAKVFLFPSLFEGFGMAVGEALSAHLSVVAWKIPVFEERFQSRSASRVRLVKVSDENLFVENALKALIDYDNADLFSQEEEIFRLTDTWDDVGKLVIDALDTFVKN